MPKELVEYIDFKQRFDQFQNFKNYYPENNFNKAGNADLENLFLSNGLKKVLKRGY